MHFIILQITPKPREENPNANSIIKSLRATTQSEFNQNNQVHKTLFFKNA